MQIVYFSKIEFKSLIASLKCIKSFVRKFGPLGLVFTELSWASTVFLSSRFYVFYEISLEVDGHSPSVGVFEVEDKPVKAEGSLNK